MGNPLGGGVSAYMIDGVQHVAIAARMNNPIIQTGSDPTWVASFALPGDKAVSVVLKRSQVARRSPRAAAGGPPRPSEWA
jgi:hypothetical protein